MNICIPVEYRKTNKYIQTNCAHCNKIIWRQYYRTKNNIVFCSRPAYCSYIYKLKQRDIKAYNILNNINTPNFYYLIGLICTDGNIRYHNKPSKNLSYNCEINLHKQDRYILEEIYNLYGGKLYNIKDNTCRWIITNKNFIEYLINIGITERKSKTLNINNWFNTLTDENKLHVIRGIIDGDGSIKIYKHNFRTANICTGSKHFFNMIKTYFTSSFPNSKLCESHYTTYSYIQFNGKNMIEPFNKIYNDIENTNLLYIKRKYETFKQIRNYFV